MLSSGISWPPCSLLGTAGQGADSFVMSLEPAIAAKSSGTILQADGIADRVCRIGISRLCARGRAVRIWVDF